jgi:hypothetical protein
LTEVQSPFYRRRCGRHYSFLHRIFEFNPCIEASSQWTYACNPKFVEFERHPGARSFAWSSTVKHHVLITRDLGVPLFQFFGCESDGAGDPHRLRFKCELIAEVYYDH